MNNYFILFYFSYMEQFSMPQLVENIIYMDLFSGNIQELFRSPTLGVVRLRALGTQSSFFIDIIVKYLVSRLFFYF